MTIHSAPEPSPEKPKVIGGQTWVPAVIYVPKVIESGLSPPVWVYSVVIPALPNFCFGIMAAESALKETDMSNWVTIVPAHDAANAAPNRAEVIGSA